MSADAVDPNTNDTSKPAGLVQTNLQDCLQQAKKALPGCGWDWVCVDRILRRILIRWLISNRQSTEQAEDLYQEMMMELFKYCAGIEPDGLLNYAFVVVRRLILKRRVKLSTVAFPVVGGAGSSDGASRSDATYDPEDPADPTAQDLAKIELEDVLKHCNLSPLEFDHLRLLMNDLPHLSIVTRLQREGYTEIKTVGQSHELRRRTFIKLRRCLSTHFEIPDDSTDNPTDDSTDNRADDSTDNRTDDPTTRPRDA